MSWVAVGAAAISAGATLYGSSRANAANRDATAAATAANEANLQLAREQRQQNTALYAPELARGNRADAFRGFLTYGSGRYRTSPSGAAGEAYGQSVPDYAGYTAQWDPTTSGNPTSPWHAIEAGLGDPSAPDYARRWAEAYDAFGGPAIPTTQNYSDVYGDVYGGQTIDGEYTDVTQADIDGLVRNQFGWRQGDEDYAFNSDLTDEQFLGDMGLLTDQRDTAYGRAEQGLFDRNAIARAAYDSQLDLYDQGYAEGEDLLGDQYATRQGFTNDAIAARTYLNNRARADFLDRAGSSFGVTGRLGSVQDAYARSVADEDAAYADTIRGYQNADFNPYAEGMSDLSAWRSQGRVGAGQTRDNRAWDAYGAYADDMGGADAGYYAGALQSWNNYGARRQQNYTNLSNARTGAYNDWYGGIMSDSNRGQTGRNAIAGFNGAYTSAATNANNANANAQAQGAQNAANIWTSAAGNIADIAGNAAASWRRRTNPYGTNTQAGDPPFPI